jgi:hypothetical protein
MPRRKMRSTNIFSRKSLDNTIARLWYGENPARREDPEKFRAVDGREGLGRGNITTSLEYPYNAMPEVFSAKSAAMHQHPRACAFDNERASLHGWQDRVRDPSLTVLLVLQVFLLFVALPLAAVGVPIAEPVAWLVLLVALTFVVVLSRRGVAIVTILLGLAAVAASGLYPGERFFSAFALRGQWSSVTASVLNHGGFMLAFSALTWVGRTRSMPPVASPSIVFKARSSCI